MAIPSIGDCTRFRAGTQYYSHNEELGTGTILYFVEENVARVSFGNDEGSYDLSELELCACGGVEDEGNPLYFILSTYCVEITATNF